jgi:5-methylcytosine-specific restriction endonuclease McrA
MGKPLTPCPKCRRLKCEHPRRKPREGPSPYTRQWRNLRAKAIAAQPWCSFCGTPGGPGNALQGDHIIPVSLGGTNTASNIRGALSQMQSVTRWTRAAAVPTKEVGGGRGCHQT